MKVPGYCGTVLVTRLRAPFRGKIVVGDVPHLFIVVKISRRQWNRGVSRPTALVTQQDTTATMLVNRSNFCRMGRVYIYTRIRLYL
jgi:hypothetical protein